MQSIKISAQQIGNISNFSTLSFKDYSVIMPTKLPNMKKLFFAILLLIGIICISSCDYDDSNDLEVITPNDSTQTGIGIHQKTL